MAISIKNLPEPPYVLVLEKIDYVYQSVSSINTHYGCNDPKSGNFNFQVNVDDGTCNMTRGFHSFGGVYQTCDNSQDLDVCNSMMLRQKNPLTNDYTCPEGFQAIQVHTDTVAMTTSAKNCLKKICYIFGICHEDCSHTTSIDQGRYHAYWCAFPPNPNVSAPTDSGYMFGGVYTSNKQNPVTI